MHLPLVKHYFMKIPYLVIHFAISIVALIFSIFGLLAGIRLGETIGKQMEIIGGLILPGIGVRVVYPFISRELSETRK